MTLTKSQKARRAAQRAQENNGRNKQKRNNSKQKQIKGNGGMSRKDVFDILSGAFSGNTVRFGKSQSRSVANPVSKAFIRKAGTPSFMTGSDGSTVIRHSEYIRDIEGADQFTLTSFALNPGVGSLFPWLSTIAPRYESYQFLELCFRYETVAPTSTSGTVILAVDYNANCPAPESKTQILSMESSVRTPVWSTVEHRSLVHNLTKRQSYFVRGGATVVDPSLYDVGRIMVAVQGVPSENPSIGELYVDYSVRLTTPVLPSSTSLENSVKITSSAGVDYQHIFGTTPVKTGDDKDKFIIVDTGIGQAVQVEEANAYLFSYTLTFTSSVIFSFNYDLNTDLPNTSYFSPMSNNIATGVPPGKPGDYSSDGKRVFISFIAKMPALTQFFGILQTAGPQHIGCVCRISPYDYSSQ